MSVKSPRPEEIEALIQQFQNSDATELHIRSADFELLLSKNPDGTRTITQGSDKLPVSRAHKATPVQLPAKRSATSEATKVEPELGPNMVFVRAPYMGTFYRAPKPGAKPYVDIDELVEADAELCLIEVMKLFTAVRAGARGHIRRILAKDGEMIAAGQALFTLEME